ncbi:MAG TPA: alpha/beta hydrolase [bacterium]|nr:alpha/beta hydrolase [bacterium]
MSNLRSYGPPPFRVAVLHGGPGVSGEMAPVAQELSADRGVLEPLQTRDNLDGQVEELRTALDSHGDDPFTLIGYSWGAWLGWILASRHPSLVRKLVLVSSGPFEDHYASQVQENRLKRLSREEQAEVRKLSQKMEDPNAFARFGEIMARTDFYDPIPVNPEGIQLSPDIYQGVWPEAKGLRKSGELLQMGGRIQCPVVAVHGDHDPHPADGVREPLARVLREFRFVLLERCGHTPWMEKYARDRFFELLGEEIDR